MGWEAWVTLAVVGLIALALLRAWASPDTVLLGAMTLLMLLSFVSDRFPNPEDMVAGFGNEGLITIAVLFVVAAGLTQTGAMSMVTGSLLGRPKTTTGAQLRMMGPVAGLSAFLNNTPIVAMFVPVVADWSRKTGINASKLMMPLSYAAIAGGVCSLIGTSTNIYVDGLVQREQSLGNLPGVHLGMFTIAWVGVPVAAATLLYVLLASPKLLADRSRAEQRTEDARRYTVEMMVQPGGAVDGQTIERAGLRQLPGLFLSAIEREDERIIAVGPDRVLHGNDRLFFVGVVNSVVDLQKIRGLVPAPDQVFKLREPRPDRILVEAVVGDQFPNLGDTVRAMRFRTRYNAVVIAVHRQGRHLNQKVGDIVLEAGDTLLLETTPRFVESHRQSRDFYLISALEGSTPLRHHRAWVAIAILAAMVVSVTAMDLAIGRKFLLTAALLASGLMVLTGCCKPSEARAGINWRILLAFGAAIGVGEAIKQTGAAHGVAEGLLDLFGALGPHGVLAGVYLLTLIFNMTIGHLGAAAMVFPVAIEAASVAGPEGAALSYMPFVIALMVAASCDFASPLSYPTHLIVWGAGGYRFADFVRFGLPLNLIVAAIVVALAPIVWPF